MRNEEVLHKFDEKINILYTAKRRKVNLIGNTLHRNCLIKHIIDQKIGKVIRDGKTSKRRKQLLDDINET